MRRCAVAAFMWRTGMLRDEALNSKVGALIILRCRYSLVVIEAGTNRSKTEIISVCMRPN